MKINEIVNTGIMKQGWKSQAHRDGLDLRATANEEGLSIFAYDAGGREIGFVHFEIINNKLESFDTWVDPRMRRQGIATVMYNYAKELGNDIAPSTAQTPDGRKFWKSIKKQQTTENFADGNLQTIIQSFVNSPSGQKYKQYDCKTVTRAFVQWAEQNKIPTQVVALAQPSADFIAKNPQFKGKSGQGDAHIMPIVNSNAIDFTVRQFGVGRPFNNPLITPTSSLPAVYGKFGYFTDKPKWFAGGKSHWIGSLNSIPRNILDQNFGDELLKQGMYNEGSHKLDNVVTDLEQDLENPHSYDAIDHMMQTIAREHDITAKQLHDMFVAKHGQVPDEWVNELEENFADGKNPQDKGDSRRHGIPKHATLAQLDKIAKEGGRRGQLAHWQANMRRGRK